MKKYNFFAGPSVLPEEVKRNLEKNIFDYEGNGISMIETSHRGAMFDNMYKECIALFKELLSVPDTHEVFFMSGGATLQFANIPMAFLKPGTVADYAKTGAWSNKAYNDAVKLGDVNVYYDGKDNNYTSLPDVKSIKPSKNSSYMYLCSNETIGGIEWKEFPETGDVPLIADMSSDIFSRPIDVSKFGMIYGGVQKNLAPAGATFIVLRKDMLDRMNDNLPAYLDYRLHVKAGGLYNTPSVFSIWTTKLSLDWIKANGGVEGMKKRAELKAGMLYKAMEDSDGYYRSVVDPKYRSLMNIPFRMKTEELEAKFLKEATAAGMMGLKGHKSVGGLRASVYNALPVEDVQALVDFMKEFQRNN